MFRLARRASLYWMICSLVACQVYDAGLLPSDAATRDTGTAPIEAGTDSSVCVPTPEICNGRDDDCNGIVDDENSPSIQAYCAMRVLHATSTCSAGQCVYRLKCDAGYYNCDGRPDNGCESKCPCVVGCPDAAPDGSADDGGADAG